MALGISGECSITGENLPGVRHVRRSRRIPCVFADQHALLRDKVGLVLGAIEETQRLWGYVLLVVQGCRLLKGQGRQRRNLLLLVCLDQSIVRDHRAPSRLKAPERRAAPQFLSLSAHVLVVAVVLLLILGLGGFTNSIEKLLCSRVLTAGRPHQQQLVAQCALLKCVDVVGVLAFIAVVLGDVHHADTELQGVLGLDGRAGNHQDLLGETADGGICPLREFRDRREPLLKRVRDSLHILKRLTYSIQKIRCLAHDRQGINNVVLHHVQALDTQVREVGATLQDLA